MTEIERQILMNQKAIMDCLSGLMEITGREAQRCSADSMSTSKMHRERLAILRADTRDMLAGKINKATREFAPCPVCGTTPLYNYRMNLVGSKRNYSIFVECPHKDYSAHKDYVCELAVHDAQSQAEAMRIAVESWNNLVDGYPANANG